jgi:hypothetical protein
MFRVPPRLEIPKKNIRKKYKLNIEPQLSIQGGLSLEKHKVDSLN